MKRALIVLMIAMAAFGLCANGAGETAEAETVIFGHETMVYQPVGEIEVAPTEDIIDIFEDYVEDYLDDYDTVEEYLAVGTDLNAIPEDVRDYFYDILADDTDDIMDVINDALKDELVRGEVEYSYMNIGPYQFTATLDFPL